MGFIRKQFLDIIQWLDDGSDKLVYMFPMEDQEIQNGAQLTVRPGQVAVFVDKGQIADVFGPGMYTLKTENLPVLSDLKHWAYGFKSPFKADVLFINMKEFLDNKWGTANPVWIPDTQFGQVQVRAHGGYAFKIENPVKFINSVAGGRTIYKLDEITSQLRSFIVNQFTDIIGRSHMTVTQIAASYNELAAALKETLAAPFGDLGLTLTQFTIANIGLPEEIEKSLRELTHMNIITSVQSDKLSKLQILKQLEIMEKATENPGMNSMMQSGMGLGMGMQTAGNLMNGFQQMQNNMQQQSGQMQSGNMQQSGQMQNGNIQQQSVAQQGMIQCSKCHAMIPGDSKFCCECGAKVEQPEVKKKFCSQCGQLVQPGVKFCPQCGSKLI